MRELGEIINGGILLISYGQYSLGWKLGIEYLKSEIENGAFGVILNTTVPVRKLCERAKTVGFDMLNVKDNLAVVNMFKEPIKTPDFVYTLDTLDENVIIPKMGDLMEQLAEKHNLKERKVIGIIATLDGIYELFGQRFLKKLIMGYLIRAEKLIYEGYSYWAIFLVNRDAIPKELHSWIVSVSDYVILTEGIIKENELVENTILLKSLAPDFSQRMFQTRIPAEKLKVK